MRTRRVRFGVLTIVAVAVLGMSAIATARPGSAAGATGVKASRSTTIVGPAATVGADFSASAGTGHGDVFGATINQLDDPAKMDTLQQMGMQLIRRDAYLFQIVPNTTVATYKANIGVAGSVTDPNTWDWSKYAWVSQYHSRGLRVLLIMSYDTPWLQDPCGCDFHGVPSDWTVYSDIVQKIYLHFKGEVNLVEIWNEPDGGFLNITGSPYPDNLSAYRDIYLNASNAIRAVDSAIPVGGPVVASPALTSWGTALLQDTRIPANNISFLSYHDYTNPTGEVVTNWKNAAAAAGRGSDFPIYVTEWNTGAGFNHDPVNNDHPDAISYTAGRMTNMYKQRANGSTYYAYNDPLFVSDFDGIYANGTLFPKARTIRLLSEDLGLGAGDSTIRNVSFGSPLTNAGAATNAAGDDVAWVVNDSTGPVSVTLNMTGLGGMTSANANIFEASANQAVVSPRSTIPLTVSGGNATVLLGAPPKSVVGVRLTPYVVAQQENIAPAATVTTSSVSGGLPGSNATDGVIGVWGAGEWASNAELTPWIQLNWPTAQTVGRVVLYDRSNTTDQIHAGTLIFSDGSTVAVPELPNDGTGKAIDFPARTLTSVKLQVTSGSGSNVGLSEFQVFRAANIAAQATITASSAVSTATSARKTIDGIVGQSTGQWVSTETDPWLKAIWLNTRTIDEVDLYDAVGTSHSNAGTLSFSDGSTIPVTGIPADGTVKAVTFQPKAVTSVTFQTTGGTGTHVGLSEIRVLQVPNLASTATVTASSSQSSVLAPSAATDGIINQWYSGEWASNGELTPWIQLTWPTPQAVDRIVLYDRNNTIDQVLAGTLSFSDGSTISVGALDNGGLGKTITFPARDVSSVRFQVTQGAGQNVGLSEFEIFGSTGPVASVSREHVFNGQQHVFGRGTDGSLAHAWWDPSLSGSGLSQDSWAGASSVAGEPVTFVTPGAVVQQHAFAVDAAGNLQHWFWGTNNQPNPPQHDTWNTASGSGITLAGVPTGFVYGNQQHVFARDTTGKLQHWFWFPNGTPAGQMNHDVWDATGEVAGDPVAITIGGRQHVYFTSASGTLVHLQWDPSTGMSSQTWASGVTGKPAADGIGSQQNVFVLDGAGNVQRYAWSPADAPGQVEHTAISAGVTLVGSVAAFPYGTGQQEVFARDGAGNLQHWSVDTLGAVGHDTWDAAGDMAGDPTGLTIGTQQHVFFVDRQGRLGHWYFDPAKPGNGLTNDIWPAPTTLAPS